MSKFGLCAQGIPVNTVEEGWCVRACAHAYFHMSLFRMLDTGSRRKKYWGEEGKREGKAGKKN